MPYANMQMSTSECSLLGVAHPLIIEDGGILDEGDDLLTGLFDLLGGEDGGERLGE